MNILPKKKWHVRTKENIARVRRDEAKAAEEEQQRLDRAILAENERRLEALRSQAAKRSSDLEPFTLRSSASISTSTGHVNFFQDLEESERNNFGQGNKEYQEEKRKEQAEWDSKMGIQKSFAEGTNELNKAKEWYEVVSRPWVKETKESVKDTKPSQSDTKERTEERSDKEKHRKRRRTERSSSEESSGARSKKKRKKETKKKKKKKKHKHHHSSSEDECKVDTELEIEKRNKLVALREERIRRERAERHRTQQLLNPTKTTAAPKQKYNSMFNPDLCRK
ncbi:hypothetical protein Q1695_010622 [Nippostrongylus brasiliensis]|nr:hypothetical protein Q1695_010622 [Nippostrongylus brasiliensis]